MTILKMTATFGKLSRQTLALTPELNVFTLPNESGKTTWTNFLLAMFYGVDTSERSTKDTVAVKTKYKPWSGEAMSGVIELLHKGRKITIERSAHGNVPFGTFRAYDTETGQDIPELTAENCGTELLGCEKSVFTRSALLQGNLAVDSDDALSRRLTDLVTTGSETVSFADTRDTLHKAANRIKNTLLPQKQAALSEAERALEKIREQHSADLLAQSEKEAKEQELSHLCDVLAVFSYREYRQRQQQALEKKQALADAEAQAAALRQAVQPLPEKGVLETLEKDLSQKPHLPEKPMLSDENPVFSNLSAEQANELAHRDAADCDRLREKAQKPLTVPIILAALFLAAAPLATYLLQTLFGLLALAPALFFVIWAIKTRLDNKKAAQDAAQAQAILEKYAVSSRDEILTAGASYAAAKNLYDMQLRQYDAAVAAEKERMARILGSVSMFRPGCDSPEAALAAVTDALGQYDALARAEQAAEYAKEKYALFSDAVGTAPPQPPEVDTAGLTSQTAAQQKAACEQRLSELARALARSEGAVASLGDPAELSAQKEQLTQQIALLSERQAALVLAEKTLEGANAELQTRFSPQLCMRAGAYLDQLTKSHYDALTLDVSMKTTAHETEGALTRELPFLSSGTVDQVYFSLRLAIADLVLRSDTPIILDDALIRFDDERLRSALALLREQSKHRQILLFSCHSREQNLLKGDAL